MDESYVLSTGLYAIFSSGGQESKRPWTAGHKKAGNSMRVLVDLAPTADTNRNAHTAEGFTPCPAVLRPENPVAAMLQVRGRTGCPPF